MSLKNKFMIFTLFLLSVVIGAGVLLISYRATWNELVNVLDVVDELEHSVSDIRSELISDGRLTKRTQEATQLFPTIAVTLRNNFSNPDEIAILLKMEIAFVRLTRIYERSLKQEEVMQVALAKQGLNEIKKMEQAIHGLHKVANERISKSQAYLEYNLILFVIGLIFCTIAGFYFLRKHVVNPIISLSREIEDVQKGVSENIKTSSQQDEFGILKRFTHDTIANLITHAQELENKSHELRENLEKRIRLQKSEARYRSVIDDQTELICRYSSDEKLSFVNDAFCRFFDKNVEALIGSSLKDYIFSDDYKLALESRRELSLKQPAKQVDYRAISGAGEKRWIRWTHRAIFDESNTVIEYQAVGNDITEVKHAEQKLYDQSQFLRTVIDCLTHPFYVIDADNYTIKLANKAAGFGDYSEDATCHALTHNSAEPCSCEEHPCSIAEVKRTNKPAIVEHIHYDQSGKPENFEIHAYPIYDEEGKISQVIEYSLNITERKKFEKSLLQAKKAAEVANEAKSEFLANMSHEIRTPMNGIVGITRLALDMELPDKLKEYLDLIKISAERLINVINDILDFSKIEAHMLDLDSVNFKITDVLKEVVGGFLFQGKEKGVEIEYIFNEEIPDNVIGDPGRLRQVLINLVGNALKFTQQGKVTIQVETNLQVSLNEYEYCFAVHDTGIGIPEDKKDIIFEAFSQADGSATRKYGGSGLGLAISDRIVELMEGKLWVESTKGIGSTFYFTAKLKTEESDSSRKAEDEQVNAISGDPQRKQQHILLAEDEYVNRFLAIDTIEQEGWMITAVEDGQQALDILKKQKFDLILMDIQMPNLDGLATTKKIRAQEKETGSHIPIIAMTAHAMAGDRESCLGAGMDDYITKPFVVDELVGKMTKWLS